jgi:hypothetical protein
MMVSESILEHRKEVRSRLIDEIDIFNEDNPDAVEYAILTVMAYCERYNIYELEDKVKKQAAEIARLTDLVNKESWAPLDIVAGGPGSPGYDDEIILDDTLGRELEAVDIEFPVIEEWRLPEKDR